MPEKSLVMAVKTSLTSSWLEFEDGTVTNGKLTENDIDELLKRGKLIVVDRDDVIPSTASNPLLKQKDASGNDLPIYLIPGDGAFDDSAATMTAGKAGNRQFILINEKCHKWSEAYVRQYFTDSDKQFNMVSQPADEFFKKLEAEQKNPQESLATKQHYEELIRNVTRQAHRMGIESFKIVISDYFGTSSATSREGTNYVCIGETAFRKALVSETEKRLLEAELGHELTHIKDGDTLASGKMRRHFNTTVVHRGMELRADLGGTGPLGAHNPQALENVFTSFLQQGIFQCRNEERDFTLSPSNPTAKDLQTVSDLLRMSDPDHPAFLERIMALKDLDIVMHKYEKTHVVKTDAERKLESEVVIKQVILDMQGKITGGFDANTPTMPGSSPVKEVKLQTPLK